MAPTIKDVALEAGVSVKTVSNVVNNYIHVSPRMRQVVTSAIEKLGYRPNISARNLRRGRTGLIALALPSLANPYFAELAQSVVETADRADLTVLVDCTDGSVERERTVVEGLGIQLVDGIILCPHALTADDLRACEGGPPLVLLSEMQPLVADSIAIDSTSAARAATDHLVSTARRRIAVVGFAARQHGPVIAQRRLQGYRAGIRAAGLRYDSTIVALLPDDSVSLVMPAVQALLAEHPDIDAIFCYNDKIALAVLRALLSAGIAVPQRVAVIGIDDVEASRLSSPSLSTIGPDTSGIAGEAVTLLQARIDGDDSPVRQVVAGFRLLARESTAPSA
ncbi:MAG: LacI family DNA-binding transcriptional regulator [Nakamurella sp.]